MNMAWDGRKAIASHPEGMQEGSLGQAKRSSRTARRSDAPVQGLSGEISYSPPKTLSAATCRRFKLSIAVSIEEEGLSAPMLQQITKSGDKSPHSKLLP